MQQYQFERICKWTFLKRDYRGYGNTEYEIKTA